MLTKTLVSRSSVVLQAPIRQIAANAGAEGSIIVGKLPEGGDQSRGFNAQAEEYVNMVDAGIVDPTKVVHRITDARQ